jgi:hypothetical protein
LPGVYQTYLFFQRISFLFHWFFVCFFLVSISLTSACILIISFLRLVLGFACSCFSRCLSYSIRSLIWDRSVLLIYALMTINFPLRTDFAVFSFSLTSRNLLISSFISSLTHWSLSNMLFSFQMFGCFLLLFLLLSSSFNALWSDRMRGIISVFLYLLRLALCPKHDQFWRKFHGLLRRMYNVQKLDEIFCTHQIGPFDL